MNEFIVKILKYLFLVSLLFLTLLYFYLNKYEPYIDSNYSQLTQYHNDGLIVGTSRAAIDIEPSVISHNLYNFAFTIDISPFGKSYFDFIIKFHKVQTFDSNRIHLVTVDPWSIRSVKGYDTIINSSFTNYLFLPPTKPNFEYIFKFGNLSIWEVINVIKNRERNLFINENGRLVKRMSEDFLKKDYDRKSKLKINNYKSSELFLKGYQSKNRIKYLIETIKYLKKDGKVYLVRLPISNQMLEIENAISPDFNELISEISDSLKVKYINFTIEKNIFRTTDGHHIWDEHVIDFSQYLKKRLKK